MKNKLISALFCLLAFAVFASAQNRSVYTDLSDTKCKTLESNDDEGGSYLGECAGVGGYKLHLIEGDLRQSITVVTPAKKKHELELWREFGGFSSVGTKAEWRTKKGVPVALIVRFNVSENPEDSSKITSYLIVAKVSKTAACVTDVVKPGKTQNLEARKLADAAMSKDCKAQQ